MFSLSFTVFLSWDARAFVAATRKKYVYTHKQTQIEKDKRLMDRSELVCVYHMCMRSSEAWRSSFLESGRILDKVRIHREARALFSQPKSAHCKKQKGAP